MLTEEQRALLPGDADVAFYREHGYYVSGKIFTDAEIEAAVVGSERFYRSETDDLGVTLPDVFRPKAEYAADKLRKNDYASLQCRALAHLVRHPVLAAIAAGLAQTPSIRLWHDQLLWKPPSDPDQPVSVGWHTDRGYWKTCTSANMLTAWIPFHDCDAAMGTITMIDGSPHWPDNTAGLDFFSSDLDGLERRFNTGGRSVVKVPVELERGQVSFHHCLTIHGSGPNRSDRPRRAIAVHLQDEANRYREYRFPDGRLARHANDELCRKIEGRPDYTDPLICPQLHPPAK